MEQRHVSWEEIERLSAQLAQSIRDSGFAPDYLVGIALGGLVPLALLSRELGIVEVGVIRARSYDPVTHERGTLTVGELSEADIRGKRVLLVDEIVDSGETIRHVASLLRERLGAAEVKTAVFVVHASHCTARPDFFVTETEQWVIFPWEVREREN